MRDKVGPLVGHSSDGDSRCRKLMLQKMLADKGDRYNPIGRENNFIFSAQKVVKENGAYCTYDCVGDKDWIHKGKKYVGHLDHVSRTLGFGEGKLALLNHVELIVEKIDVFQHRLSKEHTRRDRDRQNWKIAQQIAFKKVQNCFDDIIEGKIESCPPDE